MTAPPFDPWKFQPYDPSGTPFIVPGSPLDALGKANVGWVAVGILLLLIIASVDPRIGGVLLLVIVVSMVFKANDRGLI